MTSNPNVEIQRRVDPAAQTVEETEMVGGKPHGTRRIWSSSGVQIGMAEFQRGLLHGRCLVWFDDGRPYIESSYFEGRLDGDYRSFWPNGKPREIVHFEYDTSTAADGWRPIVTWSRKEFISELAGDPTGKVVAGRPVIFRTRAIQHRVAMRDILKPVFPLATYPSGFLVLHEENLTLGEALGVSSKFIYALHPKTMAYLARRWRRRGQLLVSDLRVGDNTTMPLAGEDTIGVCLEYPRRRVYYLHSLANSAVMGANATCTQVAVGVYAALFTMLRDSLAPRIYFVSDLYDTVYPQVLFANMRVEHFVFAKRKRHLVLRHHDPALRPRFPHAEEQMVI